MAVPLALVLFEPVTRVLGQYVGGDSRTPQRFKVKMHRVHRISWNICEIP